MKSPNFGYHLARFYGNAVRTLYRCFLPFIVRRRVHSSRSVDLDVFAYSNEQNLPEQVASIRSFLRHAGHPRSFTVLSDGSHSARSIRLLERIDPGVSVQRTDVAGPASLDKFKRYLETHPTGKQLGLIMNLPRDRPAFYTDSDVLFFEGAKDLLQGLAGDHVSACYLADCRFSGDDRLLRDASEKQHPVNTGVLLLFRPLDWSLSLARFAELEGEPNFFTNQTMTHLTMHQNSTIPFDPQRYVLQLDDQFVFRDRYASARLVLRHYVNPVRHKFWTSLR
jgi:hypothetical protein